MLVILRHFCSTFLSFVARWLKSKMSGYRSCTRWVAFQAPSFFLQLASSGVLLFQLQCPGDTIFFHVTCHASLNMSPNPSTFSCIDTTSGYVCSKDKHRPSAPLTNEAHASLQLGLGHLHSLVACTGNVKPFCLFVCFTDDPQLPAAVCRPALSGGRRERLQGQHEPCRRVFQVGQVHRTELVEVHLIFFWFATKSFVLQSIWKHSLKKIEFVRVL